MNCRTYDNNNNNPPVSEASKEVANLTERKQTNYTHQKYLWTLKICTGGTRPSIWKIFSAMWSPWFSAHFDTSFIIRTQKSFWTYFHFNGRRQRLTSKSRKKQFVDSRCLSTPLTSIFTEVFITPKYFRILKTISFKHSILSYCYMTPPFHTESALFYAFTFWPNV